MKQMRGRGFGFTFFSFVFLLCLCGGMFLAALFTGLPFAHAQNATPSQPASNFALSAPSADAPRGVVQAAPHSVFFLPEDVRLENRLTLNDGSDKTPEQIKRELSVQYLQNCRALIPAVRRTERPAFDLLCECAAGTMQEQMEAEDMQALFNDPENAHQERETLLALVYFPCLELPVLQIERNSCNSNPALRAESSNHAQTCQCYGQYMSRYAKQGLNTLNRHNIRQYTSQTEPHVLLTTVMSNSYYAHAARGALRRCSLRTLYGSAENP